jgi:hypothetical protein
MGLRRRSASELLRDEELDSWQAGWRGQRPLVMPKLARGDGAVRVEIEPKRLRPREVRFEEAAQYRVLHAPRDQKSRYFLDKHADDQKHSTL